MAKSSALTKKTTSEYILYSIVFFIFCIIDGITFTWAFLLLAFPIFCMISEWCYSVSMSTEIRQLKQCLQKILASPVSMLSDPS